MAIHQDLQKKLITKLKAAADSKKAPQMQAYMKSKMPYYGVQSPFLKEICRELFKDLHFKNHAEWEKTILHIWRNAKRREERYAALRLASHRSSREFQNPKAMKMYEEIIVDGAWWDFVDETSARVGEILRNYPDVMKKMMLKWSTSPNFWKRRVSIISQLKFKTKTDLKLLYACIEPSISSDEFFLRKAIGWALRQYAWTDPKEVKRYVKQNEARLSGLSKREALKNA